MFGEERLLDLIRQEAPSGSQTLERRFLTAIKNLLRECRKRMTLPSWSLRNISEMLLAIAALGYLGLPLQSLVEEGFYDSLVADATLCGQALRTLNVGNRADGPKRSWWEPRRDGRA